MFPQADHQGSQIRGQSILADLDWRNCYLQMIGTGIAALGTLVADVGLETLAVNFGLGTLAVHFGL